MYVISKQCHKKTKSNGWFSKKHNDFVLKIEKLTNFAKEGDDIYTSLSWAG